VRDLLQNSETPSGGGAVLVKERIMPKTLNEETLFWMRLAAFASLSEHVLATGASLPDAEELLFGWQLPGDLPSRYACLSGGRANLGVLG
jgi:hypothetical protein